MIKRETIDLIREQSDIVQIINEYLPLKKAGKYYRTLCPFHTEKSPSFYVSQDRQIYHCFGCGASGSVITFLMQYEKLSFLDAVKKLADKVGIKIESEVIPSKYQELYQACDFACNFYTECLNKSKIAQSYIKFRKLSNETIKRFRIGFAPTDNLLVNAARKQNISEEILLKAGLVVKKNDKYFDWFYNRLIFPIFSVSGKVIGFSARAIDDTTQPKYINTTETPIFKKGENLFGLYQAKNYLYQLPPILVEGNFDLLSLVDNDILNVIAPLGTALTTQQAQLIRRYSNQIIIAFDSDSAGQTATLRTLEILLPNNIEPRIVHLPTQYDPDKYINTYGKDKFLALINESLDFIDYIITIKPSDSIHDKQNCLKQILNYIALIEEPMIQELYLNKTANLFKITKEVLFKKIKSTVKSTYAKKSHMDTDAMRYSSLEKQILCSLILNPSYTTLAKQEIITDCFQDNNFKEIIGIIYENFEKENLSTAKLIDLLEKPELKKIVADLTFVTKTIPKESEFRRKLLSLKSKWLYQEIQKAKNNKESDKIKDLTLQHYEIKRKINQLRSNIK